MKYYLNISDKYKTFVWTPERTGSNHLTNIIRKLGFKTHYFEDDKLIRVDDLRLSSYCKFFENHSEYSFILSTRNPYSSQASLAGAGHMHFSLENREIVRERMEREFQFPVMTENCCNCFHIRTPDYFLKTESLYEDYLKIPFIKNHEINQSGELEKLCKEKMNSSPTILENYWKKFYDQDMADLVYYNNVNNFELFGYDKQSWKE
jgi:hypothetical protein